MNRLTRTAAAFLTTFIACLVLVDVASAEPPYQDALDAKYPNAAKSLAGCIACHPGGNTGGLTSFGLAYDQAGRDFTAGLEAADSDGDGFTNLAELTANPATNPGDAASKPAATVPATNYQGLWWNSNESGWGINFAHQGDIIFATWFTYDAAGKPWWLVAELHRNADGTYSGAVTTLVGSPFDAVPFDTAKVKETPVGSMTASFSAANDGSIAYTVNGIAQTKAITRQKFGTLPTCTFGALANLAAATNYTDLWWNDKESGWGVNFSHQDDIIFATWFTYDAAGKPWWLVAELHKTGVGVYTGGVSVMVGSPFNATPFDTTKVVETSAGTATVTFANGNAATFASLVNGVSQAKAIARQVFVAPGTVCQ